VRFIRALEAFERDGDTDVVLLIGEIGGLPEVRAAQWAREHLSKPLVANPWWPTSPASPPPPGRRMGHAGATISGTEDTARAKVARLNELGAHVVENLAQIGESLQRVLGDCRT
jgi:succinyl-CoA synthetase alpha subunit